MKKSAFLVLGVMAACLHGCGNARPVGAPACQEWTTEVGNLLASKCGKCHGDAKQDGQYSVATYQSVLGTGTDDVPNAIAGDSSSKILTVLEAQTAKSYHQGFGDVAQSIDDWVVRCQLAYTHSSVHTAGIMNPAESDFHGSAIVREKGDTSLCETCHGSDLDGGKSGVTCRNCHQDGPKSCSTCHGSATSFAADTAHGKHLRPSGWAREVACADCHAIPSRSSYDSATPSHFNGTVDLNWGGLAEQTNFDRSSKQCSDSYCHGATLGSDRSGQSSLRTPAWTKVDGSQVACGGACHTNPPGGKHPASTNCEDCHADVIAGFKSGNPPTVTWKNASRHIDGTVDLAVGETATCFSCHGDDASMSPPSGTHGETNVTDHAVGAHRRHLSPSDWHRAGVCSDCHTKPGSMSHSNGKVDFNWSALANGGGASTTYSTDNYSCTKSYCHGSTLAGARAGGSVNRTPIWNQVDGRWNKCGSTCHTCPPGGTHPSSSACAGCHGTSIDSFTAGNPPTATWTDASLHINGEVDF